MQCTLSQFQKLELDMVNKFDLEDLNEDDVISINSQMMKAGKFKQDLKEAIWSLGVNNAIRERLKLNGVYLQTWEYGRGLNKNNFLKEGIDIELLRIVGKGWQKGQVRISLSLDVYLDEPEITEAATKSMSESPLDDIRRTMNRNN